MDHKTKILIAFPVVLAIILVFAAHYVPFTKDLSEAEQQILEFVPSDLKIRAAQIVHAGIGLKSPILFKSPETARKPVPKRDLAPQIDYNVKNVSLIVITGGKKMAIIEGKVLSEGDSIDGLKIARIEPERVLTKDKTERWLYLNK